MSLGEPWTTTTAASSSKKNITSVISDTGTNLSTYDKTKFKIVVCTEDGDVFIKDHVYLFGIDTSEIDLTELQSHYHSSGTDGGSLIWIYISNPEVFHLLLTRPTDVIKANWNQTVTGTGSIEDGGGGSGTQYIRLRPNGTSGSGATISYTHSSPNLTFDEPSAFVASGNFETATSLAFHAGVNADDVTVADTNNRKYQAEVCTATNDNWWLRTADGTSTSASDVGVDITTTDDSIKIIHNPNAGTPEAIIEIDAANTFTKTTNIPTTGSPTTGNLIKFSIKNSTAADRPYRMKGCQISFMTAGSWGYG